MGELVVGDLRGRQRKSGHPRRVRNPVAPRGYRTLDAALGRRRGEIENIGGTAALGENLKRSFEGRDRDYINIVARASLGFLQILPWNQEDCDAGSTNSMALLLGPANWAHITEYVDRASRCNLEASGQLPSVSRSSVAKVSASPADGPPIDAVTILTSNGSSTRSSAVVTPTPS